MFADWRSTSRAEDITENQQRRQAPGGKTGSRDRQSRTLKAEQTGTRREDKQRQTEQCRPALEKMCRSEQQERREHQVRRGAAETSRTDQN